MTKSIADLSPAEADEYFLRLSFEAGRRAEQSGNHPFGAVLVDGHRNLLMEAGNAYFPSRDATAHAERLLATEGSKQYDPEFLAECTMYSSAEPCAMCAGAIYWAGVGRLVFGLSEKRLLKITGNHPENPTLDLDCRKVFESGQRATEVVGPLLEDEAALLHVDFWRK